MNTGVDQILSHGNRNLFSRRNAASTGTCPNGTPEQTAVVLHLERWKKALKEAFPEGETSRAVGGGYGADRRS
jgi:hypothetical protein